MAEPIVTVVVSAREGHFLAEASLLSVLADDCAPFDLIYIDNGSPPTIEAAIRAHCSARGFRILRHDDWIAPAAARKQALAHVKTKYAAFVDNDVLVERGCLEKLIACAEETGAGLVSPLYLQGGRGIEPTIHMAGGVFVWSDGDDGVLLSERHLLLGAPLDRAEGLTRRSTDFIEYHYVLGRMDLLGLPGAISDDVLLVHEHIDLALFAREQRQAVFLEPSARITYLAFGSRCLMDAAFYRRRWDVEACEQSLLAFERRWPHTDRAGVTDPMRSYAHYRLQEFEVRRDGSAGEDLAVPMAREELAQTRHALREQAFGRGYTEAEVLALEQACDFATQLFDGLYRPDGRPFLNHVIGTASALLRYELRIDIVQACLTHAAYTHRPSWICEEDVARTLQTNPQVDWLVRTYPAARNFLAQGQGDPQLFTVAEAEVFCLLAANQIDMLLSGEYRATGRPTDMTSEGLATISATLACLGLDGLARTASSPVDAGRAWPLLGAGIRHASFRLDPVNRTLVAR